MKVTVGVPIYNVEQYVERCAISIFEQSYSDIEVIFVDDGSPDNSLSLLENLLERYPERKSVVRFIKHHKNMGLAAARNTIVNNATGDFIIHVDSDDFIDKKLVEKCVKKQQERNFDIVLYDYYVLNKDSSSLCKHKRYISTKERTLGLLSRNTTVCIWGGMYRLSLYKNNKIRCIEGVNNNEDYQVTPKLSYYSKSIVYINEPLYFYNCTNSNSITSGFSVSNAEQGWKSILILHTFFKGKGKEYEDALEIASINRLASYLKGSLLIKNKDYFVELQNRFKDVNMNLIGCVPLKRRIYLLSNNYTLLSIYTLGGKIIMKIKHSFIPYFTFLKANK